MREDKLQSVLWCVHQIVSAYRIRKPRHPTELIVMELNAIVASVSQAEMRAAQASEGDVPAMPSEV